MTDIEITDQNLEEYNDKLQGLLENFLAMFTDLQKRNPCLAFLVNPFIVDMVNDGCTILEALFTESSAVEMKLM